MRREESRKPLGPLLIEISFNILEATFGLAFQHSLTEERLHFFVRVDYFVEQVLDSL